MERIPILTMGRLLLVTIQIDMQDRLALNLQDDLTNRIAQDRAHGVLTALNVEKGMALLQARVQQRS